MLWPDVCYRLRPVPILRHHLIPSVRIVTSVGFLCQEHTLWRYTAAYNACWEILWSLATGLQIPVLVHAWKMLEQHKSHIKPWLRERSLGVASVWPQFSTSLAHDLSFHQSFWLYSAAFMNECLQNLGVAALFCVYLIGLRTAPVLNRCCLLVWCAEEWWCWWWRLRVWQICRCRENLLQEYTIHQLSLCRIDTQSNSCSPNTFCFSSSHIVV